MYAPDRAYHQNNSCQFRSSKVRGGFHDVGGGQIDNWYEVVTNPPCVIVLYLQLMNNNRATLDAVSAKQWKVVVRVFFFVGCEV